MFAISLPHALTSACNMRICSQLAYPVTKCVPLSPIGPQQTPYALYKGHFLKWQSHIVGRDQGRQVNRDVVRGPLMSEKQKKALIIKSKCQWAI